MSEWVGFDKGKTFIFPEDTHSLPLVISIDVPSDAQNGVYTATANIVATPAKSADSQEDQGVTASVIAGVFVQLTATVTGEQVRDYSVSSIEIPNGQEGSPLTVLVTIKNKGNVVAGPTRLRIDILDKLRKGILISQDIVDIPPVKPYTEGTSGVSLSPGLQQEQYWAGVKVYDGDNILYDDQIAFEILKEGSLKKSGTLESIDVQEQVNEGDIVKIGAVFVSTGDMPVQATFVAEIYKGDGLVEVVESEAIIVDNGKTDSLEAYFTPSEAGEYTVKGHVRFVDRKTDTKEAAFLVGAQKKSLALHAGIAIVLIGLAVLVVLRKRKKSVIHKIHLGERRHMDESDRMGNK